MDIALFYVLWAVVYCHVQNTMRISDRVSFYPLLNDLLHDWDPIVSNLTYYSIVVVLPPYDNRHIHSWHIWMEFLLQVKLFFKNIIPLKFKNFAEKILHRESSWNRIKVNENCLDMILEWYQSDKWRVRRDL